MLKDAFMVGVPNIGIILLALDGSRVMPVLISTGIRHSGVSERENTGSFAIVGLPGDCPVKVVVEIEVITSVVRN